MTFGQRMEYYMVKVLLRAGYNAIHANKTQDRIFKVDIWVCRNKYWIPIQFSINQEAILREKGREALQRGIVPMWMNGEELEFAVENGNGIGLAKEFWHRMEETLKNFPAIKKFKIPYWTHTQLIR